MTFAQYFINAIAPESTESEKEGLHKVLEGALKGDLCTPLDTTPFPEGLVEENPTAEFPSAPFCRFQNLYYLQKNWVFETRVLEQLKRLDYPLEPIEPLDLQGLNQEQQEAVILALRHPLAIITGGPGTGKTYTAARIVSAFLYKKPSGKVVLAAPTGKAASRLQSILPGRAQTLHSLLGVRASSDYLDRGPLIDADLILVDECSMMDAGLFGRLLAAIPNGARLVLLGDADQLPPVQAGSLFADLLESGKVASVCLQTSLRSNQEEILSLAQAIKGGRAEEVVLRISPIDVLEQSVQYFPGPFNEEPAPEVVEQLFRKFCILSCIRQGPWGVDTLNEEIFQRLKMKSCSGEWLAIPILITKNDPETALYNGETGVLIRRFPENGEGYALFGKRKIPLSILPDFSYAYALSVHKSQGSEYDKVALLVPTGSEVFGREILYTAVTRAKKEVAIHGDEGIIRAALERSSRRRSGLRERLKLL